MYSEQVNEQIKAIQEIFVAAPVLQSIIDQMKECRDLAKLNGYNIEPDCLLVTGETGVGKTTLIQQYMSKSPRVILEDRTQIPVLSTYLPTTKSDKDVIAHLLRELGDPAEGEGGTATKLTKRFVGLLKETGVELVIIDEFHHAIETQSEMVIYKVADLLKNIVSDSKIPMVLFGMPWSKHILSANLQLAGRFDLHKRITHYTKDNFTDFRKFLNKVDQRLPFEKSSDLATEELAFRLFAASKGNMRRLMKGLIRRAAIKAVVAGQPNIPIEYFAEQFNLIEPELSNEHNPFLLPKNDIKVEECPEDAESYWDYGAKRGKKKVVKMRYKKRSVADFLVAG